MPSEDDIEKKIEEDIEKGEEKLIKEDIKKDKEDIKNDKADEKKDESEIKTSRERYDENIKKSKTSTGEKEKQSRWSKIKNGAAGFAAGAMAGTSSVAEGNGYLWFALIKHFMIDGLFAAMQGYGWWGAGWYADWRMYTFNLMFFAFFWSVYLKGLKITEGGIGHTIRTFLIAIFILMLDTQFIQGWVNVLFGTTEVFQLFGLGIFYTSRILFPWWGILIIYTQETKLCKNLRIGYAILIFALLIGALLNSGAAISASDAVKGIIPSNLQQGQLQTQKAQGYWEVNYKRITSCFFEQNTTSCGNIGKPASGAGGTSTKKNETILLQGGTDDKLTQQMSMKLTASRNSPSNVWEKEIIASATLEASAATRDVPIDLSCGLKDSKGKEIEKSGIINPMQVFVKYQNLVGTYELLTCTISKPQELKKGTNIVYFKADINNQLQLNSYLIAYFIENTELENQLNYYLTNDASAKESFISTRASKGIGEAQKQVYSRLYKDIILNDYPDGKAVSKSEVGFAKTDIVIGDIPIVGIENGKEVNLQIAIENMIDGGKITDVTGGEITLPSWLLPVEGKCPLLLDGIPVGNDFSRYSFDTEILKNIKWTDIKKGPENQKKLTPCTLKVNVTPKDILYNPNTLNPEVIQTRTFYNYEMEADGVLNVEEADLSKVQKFNPPSDIYGDTITAPVPADAGVKASDVGVFGLPGYRGIVKNGVSINAPEGSEVHSVTEGRVINKGCNEWGGNYITIQNNGNQFVFTYAYLNDTTVNITDTITINQIIGHVGTTAGCIQNCDDTKKLCGLKNKVTPQLYFGVYEQSDGKPLNPYCALQKAYGVPKASGC